jgi:hypothetical protein
MKKRFFALLTHPLVLWSVRIFLVIQIFIDILTTQTFIRENNLDRILFGFVLIGGNGIVLLLVFWPKGGNRPSREEKRRTREEPGRAKEL